MGRAKNAKSMSRPLGVSFLAFIAGISGLQLLLSSLTSFALSANADKPEIADALSKVSPELASRAAGLFFLIGLVYLALAMSMILLAKGYYDGRDRARRRGRAISAFAIFWAVLGIVLLPAGLEPGSPLWTILINALIIIYLGRENIKAYFRR